MDFYTPVRELSFESERLSREQDSSINPPSHLGSKVAMC